MNIDMKTIIMLLDNTNKYVYKHKSS